MELLRVMEETSVAPITDPSATTDEDYGPDL